ncbi:hypothetical protein PQI07_15725 [Methylobacterium sp. 092160098-2]|uniref:hypothetical protein n=1 Tax=unclassified Methylobacterium TaxID=2615210 RepID=UPI00238198C3|nr:MULTISPECIES: hypothetical protein [unclassified Methylobacterium]MDE4912138.1 hypothetical protein [Methylobacterium sp. 092160098-2]WFS05560.1 hypothetical protein P9K36_19310 [Methylobacterium sp. 391_Methyba4]
MIARRSPALSALSGAMLAAVSCFACFPASAQPLIVRVNPRLAQQGVLMFGNEPGTIQTLFETGPRYSDPSGVRVGRGSQIPGWLELGSFQNVAMPGLNPVGYYGYYISPDDRAVIVDLDSRQVVQVLRR